MGADNPENTEMSSKIIAGWEDMLANALLLIDTHHSSVYSYFFFFTV